MTKDVVNTYLRQSICLTAGMTLLALLFVNLKGDMEQLLMPICISAVFQLVACIAYGLVWKWVSSSSPASMPTLYMAAAACRMFAAVVVVMAYCLLTDNRDSIPFFVVTFLIYYFVILIYDTWYFVKIEKKTKKNNNMKYLLLCLTFLLAAATPVEASESDGIDVKEIVLGHLSDAYEWHITTVGGKHISIPLPVIVRSEATGEWHIFCSTHIEEAAEEGHDYMGFYFNEEKNGKIYERLADGTSVRPWDISITKSVVQIWIVVAIMLAIFLGCARWYKKHDPTKDVPKGFVGMVEMLVMSINDDLIKDSIGEKHYRPYAPYLLTAFFFILITNMLGLLPIFPGGANVTGNINITFFLALCTMLAINLFGNKEYWKEIFWPDVPAFLKAYPVAIMPIIEVFGIITKPFALMVRLFANMMAGHAIILSFTAIIFIGWSLNAFLGSGLTLLSFVMMLFMNCLEFLVAFIQAYVFTMLSAVFIGLAHPEEHHAE